MNSYPWILWWNLYLEVLRQRWINLLLKTENIYLRLFIRYLKARIIIRQQLQLMFQAYYLSALMKYDEKKRSDDEE